MQVGIYVCRPGFLGFEVPSEHLCNQQNRLPEANVNRWFQRGLRVKKNCWANVTCTSDMSKWCWRSHHSIWTYTNRRKEDVNKVKSTQIPSNVRLDFPMDCYVFFVNFFFQRCDFNFPCYNISHSVARHGFVQIFLHGHASFADAFNSPGLVLGSLVCRAQRSRTPRAVAGTGKDLPESPAEMKVELLEEDMVILWLGYDSDE